MGVNAAAAALAARPFHLELARIAALALTLTTPPATRE
jgi:hypothetical protein